MLQEITLEGCSKCDDISIRSQVEMGEGQCWEMGTHHQDATMSKRLHGLGSVLNRHILRHSQEIKPTAIGQWSSLPWRLDYCVTWYRQGLSEGFHLHVGNNADSLFIDFDPSCLNRTFLFEFYVKHWQCDHWNSIL